MASSTPAETHDRLFELFNVQPCARPAAERIDSCVTHATRERIMRLLTDLQSSQGLTYVCISHDMEFLTQFATDIAVMHEGHVNTPCHVLNIEGAVA